MSGGGLIGPGGEPLVPPGPDGDLVAALTVVAQNLAVIARTVDTQLQVQLRLARGWTVEQVIEDMNLIVAPRPLSRAERRELERQQRAAGNGHEHPAPPADDLIGTEATDDEAGE